MKKKYYIFELRQLLDDNVLTVLEFGEKTGIARNTIITMFKQVFLWTPIYSYYICSCWNSFTRR